MTSKTVLAEFYILVPLLFAWARNRSKEALVGYQIRECKRLSEGLR